MILGIGVDIVDVPELERRLARETFLNVFSEREKAYAERLPLQRAEILAGRWAAKEAFLKALGTGWRVEWPLNQIEVAHDEAGRPVIQLGEHLAAVLPQGVRIHCSLSHTRSAAIAYVILEQDSV